MKRINHDIDIDINDDHIFLLYRIFWRKRHPHPDYQTQLTQGFTQIQEHLRRIHRY